MKCFNDYILDSKVLKNNVINIKKYIGDSCKFCAVVKANAYGVGVESVCKLLYGIADFFAVANLKEALCIRVFDKTTPILILGYIDIDQIEIVSKNNISISIGSFSQLEELALMNISCNIHIQINSGLNRYGIRTITEYRKCIKLLEKYKHINLEGVYTHFATKNNDIKFMHKQYLRFNQFKKVVNNSNIIYHIANSCATEYSKKFHLDMVRVGYLMYGYANSCIEVKPAVSIYSSIINIISVHKGESIGYDRTFIANRNLKIAVVSIGYADGLSRSVSNKFSLIINNKICRILGLICMDTVMVDVTHINNVKIGDRVIVLGGSGDLKISLKDYADIIGTNEYEVLCNFNYKRANYIIK